ncbi:MAG: hypothetical protein QM714_08055 [Nocardioides sp.]
MKLLPLDAVIEAQIGKGLDRQVGHLVRAADIDGRIITQRVGQDRKLGAQARPVGSPVSGARPQPLPSESCREARGELGHQLPQHHVLYPSLDDQQADLSTGLQRSRCNGQDRRDATAYGDEQHLSGVDAVGSIAPARPAHLPLRWPQLQ